jgi:hypothetical protein
VSALRCGWSSTHHFLAHPCPIVVELSVQLSVHMMYYGFQLTLLSPHALLAEFRNTYFNPRCHNAPTDQILLLSDSQRNASKRLQARTEEGGKAHLPSAISEDQQSLLFIDMRNVPSQQQSYLFGRLSLELREIIYAYALCGKELQVGISGDEGLNIQHRGPHALLELRCPSAQRLLAFPKSCRLAYVHHLLFFLF